VTGCCGLPARDGEEHPQSCIQVVSLEGLWHAAGKQSRPGPGRPLLEGSRLAVILHHTLREGTECCRFAEQSGSEFRVRLTVYVTSRASVSNTIMRQKMLTAERTLISDQGQFAEPLSQERARFSCSP
jgi:hypothetical protein